MNFTVMTLCSYSAVSSKSADVETAEQFILLYTRYVGDFSGLTNFSQRKLEN